MQEVARNHTENCAKPSNKSSHIDRYEHGERSLLVFISTVMNMWNGRCEMTCCWVSPDFFVGFARFLRGFRPIFLWILLNDYNAFT